ncbi:Winged helix DNA-binding domain-containing protein [Amycolatopsis tolypomycina]|uniref:Winged helix DNA-binding domain-containing protein n=1 Tax=Amycolatopsis tolypomycina TaxID=208445 RepID=A0A1H4P4X1_9PSEU|nr:winged helix DNA-binding domain-containing protein [Amycolatopsis tolypomycina]SEC02399.1 Winged helix DNA-binding domain-containing protein [Amycolatopsis tolypomycina]
MQTLSPRALNRATLERQLLLRRAKMSAFDTIEALAGLQAQAPFPPYFGLWARLEGFQPAELVELLESRRVVRIALMRGTVHLVTAADALAWRPVVQGIYDRDLKQNALHAAPLADLDHSAVASAARELLLRGPMPGNALGAELARSWDAPPSSLTHLARGRLPLVQTPPRAIWGKAGQTTYACLDDWVGAPLSPPAPAELIARYLRAFGPATVADVQTWAGITRLGEVSAGMDLRRYRGPDGRELLDLPELTVPAEDVPAPPRLLGPFDQTILSYADRTRVISDAYRKRVISHNGLVKGTLLVDGQVCGFWEIKATRKAAAISLSPFEKLGKRDLAALEKSAGELVKWAEAASETHEVRVHPPE